MNEVITEEMKQIKMLIANTVAQRNAIKNEMQEWYERFPTERFIKLDNLIAIDGMLSELDSNYKRLWDFHNNRNGQMRNMDVYEEKL
ncbi:MAG TPA: hypothetical protein ENK90_02225 [Epsilonproteobacteria bacterium]|nr:hypothetical protein [Campylobacterota bacterium]HHE05920.1 hypothetical protein [Campylobacterota bacterium]